jgi:protein-export membrane protein SecD
MIHFQPWKILLITAICVLGVIYALPSLLDEDMARRLPSWGPNKQITLGLDLQGGSHLLLEVDTQAVVRERVNSLIDGVRNVLRKDRTLRYTGLGIEGDGVVFRLLDPGKADQVRKDIREAETDTEATVQGELFRVAFKKQAMDDRRNSAVDQSIEIVRRRVDEMGTREPTIQRQGEDRILVQLPGVREPERVKALLGKTAKLAFRFVDEETSVEDAKQGRLPASSELLPLEDRMSGGQNEIVVRKRMMVSGENLVDARASYDEHGRPAVSFKFDSVGARSFGNATRDNVGKLFAIVLDNRVISAPRIQSAILAGNGIITGSFTTQSANDLALLLRAGALPAPLKVLEERTVGADLGADSIRAGAVACLVGYLLIALLMVVGYGLFGIIANLALVLNLIFTVSIMSLLGGTLTLPGIAGMVLGLAMAVDANVLIYERMREEQRLGRSPFPAADQAFQRAFVTIVDSNLTTLIAGVFLYAMGSGPVRGFAVTLSIAIMCSMFTAVSLTRMLVSLWLHWRRPKILPI